jgi:formate dehydrogenase subunit gamma
MHTGQERLRRRISLRLLACAVTLAWIVLGAPAALAQPVRPPAGAAWEGQNTVQGQPRSDLWKDIRRGRGGTVTSPIPEGGVLIQSAGETWRSRHGALARHGGWLLLAVAGMAGIYLVLRGRIPIRGGRTGRVLPRFSLVQRVVHWFAAILFVPLAVSGSILLLGKHVLAPIIGEGAFAVVASASIEAHNLFAPLFIPASLALCITFVRGNGYRGVDLKWLLKGGGFFGGHASSAKYNFGEKSWFWWSIVMGLILSASGVALLFPSAIGDRSVEQAANLTHVVAGLLFIAFAIGHIYLGTIGMEGALEGMTRGTVDENWAKEHHDLWWAEHQASATGDVRRAEVSAAEWGDRVAEGPRR